MRNSTRAKLRKLEELAIVRLVGVKCFFCREPLIETPPVTMPYRAWLSGTCKKQLEQVTIHHRGGENFIAAGMARRDNRPQTFAMAHRVCHLSHHAKHSLHR